MDNNQERTNSFGKWLCRQRKARDWTQEELGHRIGCTPNTIGKIERDERRPSKILAKRIATAFGLAPEEQDIFLKVARGQMSVDNLPLPAQPVEMSQNTPTVLVTSCHQLRAPITDFVGRTTEIRQMLATVQTIQNKADGAIIICIRGMGGVGKTELAYHIAHKLCECFSDAQIVLELRGASTDPLSPEQALQMVIRAFTPNAKLPATLPDLQRIYCSLLHNKHALILADDALDAPHVRPLIPPPGNVMLVTSRQRFSLSGMTTVDLEQLEVDEAITVLRQSCPRLSEAEAQTLAHHCGTLPLALRVSSGILHNDPSLPVTTYLAHLADDRHRLSQLRDPDDPQLDVEASLTLSYDMLDMTAQAVFRQLGVFAADFTAAFVQAVVEVPAEVDVIVVLRSLLRRNLVQYDTLRERWRLHDLVRTLALRRLVDRGEYTTVMWRYAQAAIHLADALRTQYLTGGEAARTSLDQFDRERPHINAAWQWATHHIDTPAGNQLILAIDNATYCLRTVRDDVDHERLPQLETALTAARHLSDALGECLTLNRLGIAYRVLGRVRAAIPFYEAALTCARAINDARAKGMVLNNLGLVYQNLGEPHQAISCYIQRLALAQTSGNQRGTDITFGNLGLAYAELGQLHQAIVHYDQALALAQAQGSPTSESLTLANLALTYAELDQLPQALTAAQDALTIAQTIGSRQHVAYALTALGRITATSTEGDAAFEFFQQACTTFQEIGDRGSEAECQWYWGLALAHHGKHVQAVPLLRACITYETEIRHAQVTAHAVLLQQIEQVAGY